MLTNGRMHKGVMIGLLAVVLSLVAAVPSFAIPLPGDYTIISGPMRGSTFSLDASIHPFTHWNFAFPAEPLVGLPARVYTDADTPIMNAYIAASDFNFLQFVRFDAYPILSTSLFNVVPDGTRGFFIYAQETYYTDVSTRHGRSTPTYSSYASIPEPTPLALCLLGLLGVAGAWWMTRPSVTPYNKPSVANRHPSSSPG